jgi:hypothetical protein
MFWGWGYEDNELNKRVIQVNITIDRENFIDFNDKDKTLESLILLEGESHIRSITKMDVHRFFNKTIEGLIHVSNINHSFNNDDKHMIDVINFTTNFLPDKLYEYDIRSGEKNLRNYILNKNVIVRDRKWSLF